MKCELNAVICQTGSKVSEISIMAQRQLSFVETHDPEPYYTFDCPYWKSGDRHALAKI